MQGRGQHLPRYRRRHGIVGAVCILLAFVTLRVAAATSPSSSTSTARRLRPARAPPGAISTPGAFRSRVRLDDAVDDLDLVAGAPGRCIGLRNNPARAVLEAHGDLVALGRSRQLLDLVAEHRAPDGARNGRHRSAVAMSDLVAQYASDRGSADYADAAYFSFGVRLMHRLDHTAFGAGLRRRGACRSA